MQYLGIGVCMCGCGAQGGVDVRKNSSVQPHPLFRGGTHALNIVKRLPPNPSFDLVRTKEGLGLEGGV